MIVTSNKVFKIEDITSKELQWLRDITQNALHEGESAEDRAIRRAWFLAAEPAAIGLKLSKALHSESDHYAS